MCCIIDICLSDLFTLIKNCSALIRVNLSRLSTLDWMNKHSSSSSRSRQQPIKVESSTARTGSPGSQYRMISKAGLLKFVKYTLVFSNAFGFVLSIFLGLFGAAYPKKQFPLGYRGREMALCSLFCMLITTIGYCGAQNHNRILLIVYGASNVMIVIIVVILWFLFKENSILGNKDISNMFITTLAITIAVMFLFSFILAFHVDTLKDNSQDSIVSQSHQLLQQTTALLQRQQQHQQLLMAATKHHLPPGTDHLLQTTTTTTNLQHQPLASSAAVQLAPNSSLSSCAIHQQQQQQQQQVSAGPSHSLLGPNPNEGRETSMSQMTSLRSPYEPLQASTRQAPPLVSPIQLLPPPPPMLKSSSRNKTNHLSAPSQPPHMHQALLSPPQVPQQMSSIEHQQQLMRNQSSPLPAGPAAMGPVSSSLGQHGYGHLRGLNKVAGHSHYPAAHKQHHQTQQCHPATGALMSPSPSPSPPPPPSMATMHHQSSMLHDPAHRLPSGPRGMQPPTGCPVQYCTFQCDRTV